MLTDGSQVEGDCLRAGNALLSISQASVNGALRTDGRSRLNAKHHQCRNTFDALRPHSGLDGQSRHRRPRTN